MQQALYVALQRVRFARTEIEISACSHASDSAWGEPDRGWDHQGASRRADSDGAARDERKASLLLHGSEHVEL
eukprot:scaffold57080_cov63-Phaeocystis_antarctica.AAC.6